MIPLKFGREDQMTPRQITNSSNTLHDYAPFFSQQEGKINFLINVSPPQASIVNLDPPLMCTSSSLQPHSERIVVKVVCHKTNPVRVEYIKLCFLSFCKSTCQRSDLYMNVTINDSSMTSVLDSVLGVVYLNDIPLTLVRFHWGCHKPVAIQSESLDVRWCGTPPLPRRTPRCTFPRTPTHTHTQEVVPPPQNQLSLAHLHGDVNPNWDD